MEELIMESGVTPIYDCRFCDVVRESNMISAVIVENKSGRGAITCKAVVDASGDADVCHRAGEETVAFEKNVCAGWFFSYDGTEVKLHSLTDNFYNITSEMPIYSGVNWRDVTRLAINGRKMIIEYVKAANDKSGNAKPKVLTPSIDGSYETGQLKAQDRDIYPLLIPTCPLFRMTRRLKGSFELDESHAGQWFGDTVGMTGDWRKRGPVYHIPLSCLSGIRNNNLFAAGRCVSTTSAGWDITRVIPACAVTGQAAGTAAALIAMGQYASSRDIDPVVLRGHLSGQGVILNRIFASQSGN